MTVHVQPAEGSFESLGRQLSELMEQMTKRNYYRFSRSAVWRPDINIYEDHENLYVCCELAGLARDEVDVQVTGQVICIRGERPAPMPPASAEPRCVRCMEIDSGRFERSIELPDTADLNAVEAKLVDGLLWITVAKRNV